MKKISINITTTLLSLFIFFFNAVHAQQRISGLVEDSETGAPVSFASVTFEKGYGLVTDSTGRFSLSIRRQAYLNDSILVSAIGYSSKKIRLHDLLINQKIKLIQVGKILEQVNVFVSLKGDLNRFGYYREWKVKNQGGEIGYIFDLPFTEFLLDKVQVKLNHNYDTCWLKLHLRDVAATGLHLPENEVLNKEFILAATIKYGLEEFELESCSVSIPTNKLYVGFELLRCGCSKSDIPSFFFMGNEEGVNYYKESANSVWQKGGDYTIYVRMLTK